MVGPVHGSAPGIAGKGIANPTGRIWTAGEKPDFIVHEDMGILAGKVGAAGMRGSGRASVTEPGRRRSLSKTAGSGVGRDAEAPSFAIFLP
ncbi:MAG: hypothetical protein A9Z00_14565 [Thermobacillus sp. ZCTH02-B1]|nr:isocitrate/isopropylmalate family dehydrogenase [Thermobacillus sp. ZCTH02-B1]OUM95180.1 MAG: hypothetical protein A9Z00_14565 [Thermobacillus sp. ZCTH02-B1]